ncbi:MAG: PIN domain-containing protein [Euryarchaeota archaeon]|nr:PIN domain-containing protein [Euryarchaeota archaeon]
MIVFDAEPLVAFFLDEPGADRIETFLDEVRAGRASAACSVVNLSEVRYVLARKNKGRAREALTWLQAAGVEAADAIETWDHAADIKAEHASISLGDAFALATAAERGATLIAWDEDQTSVAKAIGVKVRK